MSDRPRVGISACLLGEPVRYDAGHKRDAWLVDALGPQVEWVPVCPEVEAGFGTPRETMHLVRLDGGDIALMTTETTRDMTDMMRRYTDRRIDELARAGLDGYVLKADSPSCGIEGVPVSAAPASASFDLGSTGRGLFAEALLSRLPHLPVADERRLADPAFRADFITRIVAHHRTSKMVQMADVLRCVDVVRVRGGARAAEIDRAATEEPLEIRLHGQPFAVIMRTPGADRELAAGFLLSERIITSADDLGTIEYCTDRQGPSACPEVRRGEVEHHDESGPATGPEVRRGEAGRDESGSAGAGRDESGPAADPEVRRGKAGRDGDVSNVVNVTLANGSDERLERLMADRRQVMTNSSCGLCGRRTIESLATDVAPIRSVWTVRAPVVAALPERLRARQAVFDETGGLHAAGLFTRDGEIVDVAEDVGRHNAVDKIVGRGLMRDALPLADHVLCVSGRTSFEIVQKAIVAGIPIVAAVSAPSSLAIELAQECGVTLVGFIRGDSFNIYAHPERVD